MYRPAVVHKFKHVEAYLKTNTNKWDSAAVRPVVDYCEQRIRILILISVGKVLNLSVKPTLIITVMRQCYVSFFSH